MSREETFCSSEGFRLNVLSSRFEALTPACFQLSHWAGWWGGACSNHLLQAEEQHLSGSAGAVAAASPIVPSGPGWWSHPFPRRSGPALRSLPHSRLSCIHRFSQDQSHNEKSLQVFCAFPFLDHCRVVEDNRAGSQTSAHRLPSNAELLE